MTNQTNKYWRQYYHDKKIVDTGDLQRNVGRTKAGKAIGDTLWQKTIEDIKNVIQLKRTDDVLELCCGNGEVIGNIATHCRTATGVDYSEKLLAQMINQYGSRVEPVHADVLDVKVRRPVDVAILYFSIQHFTEKEAVLLVEQSLMWLKPGGRMFIGDIPDESRKWQYVSKPQHQKDFIMRLIEDRPLIGTWYQPEFFTALGNYFVDIKVEVMKQPGYQINSNHRFDVLISKEVV